MTRSSLFLLSFLTWISLAPATSFLPSDAPVMALWPEGKMPGKATKAPEEAEPTGPDGVLLIKNVSQPQLIFVKPQSGSAPSPVVVVCPGGAYGVLAYNKEGTEIAAWLSSIGVSAVVLKYRVPANLDGAFQDIERTVRLVRAHAAKWNIDPKRIAVMGFSAGGHLCARLSTNFTTAAYPAIDDADKESCRPDAVVLVYPAYLEKTQGKDHLGILAPGLPVTSSMPPTLICHTEDDLDFVAGSKLYHAALDAAGAPNELIIFPTGGHGYGLRGDKDAKEWPTRCRAWFKRIGFFAREKRPERKEGSQ